MNNFIQRLPKAELHLHIEGTLEPDMMFEMADRNKIKLPYHSVEEIYNAYNFHNLQSFLDLYYQGTNVLQTEQDFYDLTFAYLQKSAKQNVSHVEIFFDPQTHTQRDIPYETVLNGISHALDDAKQKLNITSKLILCFLRHLTEKEAFETLEQALPYKNKLVAVGLDSSEAGNPPEKFQHVFAKAQSEGLLTVSHAGEEGPADYIWQALNLLNVKRIDHGVRCLEDEKLVNHLREERIPLTICPLSNIKLCVYKQIAEHPIKKLLDLGLCVTVNSDDPAYFGGYIHENYQAIQTAFDLSKTDLIQLAKNSFEASFLSENEKQRYYSKLTEIEDTVCVPS